MGLSSIGPEKAWQVELDQLRMDMPKAAFDTWVKHCELVSFEEGVFTIGIFNQYNRDWMASRLTSTETMYQLLPDKPGDTKYIPRHKLLPLWERPVERVSTRADACMIIELLAAILGGPQPIETADALLAQFNGRLSDLRRAPAHEIADIPGIGQQNAARIKLENTPSIVQASAAPRQ